MNAALPVETLVTDHLDLWTAALKRKSTAGRGSSSKVELYGIKKLRELILELAVRGLLVPQDPHDEPASELLKKIAAEKARLVKEGTIKKDKPIEPIGEDIHFDLPTGWTASPLGELAQVIRGVSYQKQDAQDAAFDNSIPLMRANNINGVLNFSDLVYVPKTIVRAEQVIVRGDLLIAMSSGSADLVGKAAQAAQDLDSTFGAFCAVLRPFTEQLFSFMGFFCKTPFYRNQTQATGKGIGIQNLNKTALELLSVVVPPLAEQRRIVAKVDELMALCDQLEQQTDASLSVHQTLVETLLSALTSAADHAQFASAWQRIAGHFDTLFTTEESIDQLKQTILQLAVMGKLVPQDPNDEPASELLKKIAAEKAKLVKEGKIKKDKPLPPISDNEVPFELPDGWAFCRLQEAIDVRDGTHDSPKDATGAKTYPLVTSKNFINGGIDFDSARRISEEDHLEISKRSLVEVDDILFSMIGGNIGNQVMVWDSRPFSVKNVALFKYFLKSATFPRFFYLYTQELAAELQNQASGGAQPFVALGYLRNLVLALPPIAEQERIVAKVDELMALCDQLRSRLSDAQTTQLHLADALVEQAIC